MTTDTTHLELCKELYKQTAWQDGNGLYQFWDMSRAVLNDGVDPQAWRNNDRGIELHEPRFKPADSEQRFVAPDYNSDFLMSKLYRVTLHHKWVDGVSTYGARISVNGAAKTSPNTVIKFEADTPKSALCGLGLELAKRKLIKGLEI